MIERRELPILGAASGAVIDLLTTGGDTIVALFVVFIESIDLLLPFLSRLAGLADVIGWIPEGSIEVLLTWVTIVFVVVYAIRIGRRFKEQL